MNPVSAAVQDTLWQKAEHIVEAGLWVPGQVLQHKTVIDTKGKLREATETQLQLAAAPDGKIAVTVLKAISHGKDVTQNARQEHKGEFPSEDVIDSSNPFAGGVDDDVTVTRLDQQKIIHGKNCVAFHYTMNTTSMFMDEEKDVVLEGIAWLDETTGVPYEMENQILSLPIKADKLTIKTFKQVKRYNYVDGRWFAVESELKMDIEFSMLLMKFKGRINTVSQFSQHWRL